MSSLIFHRGPINAAIASAVQQDISLVFFVTDNREQSLEWENFYLEGPLILPLLRKQSILLRLEQDSTEAAFLTAFCPAQKVPYMVVVKNGSLVASIPNNVTSQEEFIQRIQSIFPGNDSTGGQPQSSTSQGASTANTTTALFAERKARLESQEGRRKAQEKEERDKRIAREKARREAESPARTKYVEEQRKLREEEKAEKLRILRLVENDKIERREKEARKRQSQLAYQKKPPTRDPESGPSDIETAISFRLLDGTILKSKFLSSSKLREVRQWLDVNRTDAPYSYSFQQVFPNKSLSASDEGSSLRDLSFSHATTLVLVHRDE